jgi:hypothetical protein
LTLATIAVLLLQAAPPAPATTADTSSVVAVKAPPLFEFRSGFWLALHHVLYQQALVAARAEAPAKRLPWASPEKVRPEAAELTPSQAEAWRFALDAYAREAVSRDLLFDRQMFEMKAALSAAGNAPALPEAGLPPALHGALSRAAEVYRATAWPQHDRANRGWVAALAPQLRALGPALAADVAGGLGVAWPETPVLADVVPIANWAGAYTTTRPRIHVVVASQDPRQGDSGALEIVFHETGHGLMTAIHSHLRHAAQARGGEPPRDLWHAVLFHTVGRAVARRVPGHVPYVQAQGLWERGWQRFRQPIERHWNEHLEGRLAADLALARILDEVGVTPRAPGASSASRATPDS